MIVVVAVVVAVVVVRAVHKQWISSYGTKILVG